MLEITGNIWDYHKQGQYIVITTNGFVKGNGACVMVRGTAKQAAAQFPSLPKELGDHITRLGNIVGYFPQYRIITLPVKRVWWEKADITLIRKGMWDLKYLVQCLSLTEIYIPRPGCGNGQLDWAVVKEHLRFYDDRFVFIDLASPSDRPCLEYN